MNYRELLEAYKNGTLSEELQQKIAEDIERQDAIGEYLFDQDMLSEMADEPAPMGREQSVAEKKDDSKEMQDRFIAAINHRIHMAFAKMGLVVGIVILAVLLFVFLVLPRLVSSLYYDPGRVVAIRGNDSVTNEVAFTDVSQVETTQMSLDLAVYTELLTPESYRESVIVNDLGYGEYDINIQKTSFYYYEMLRGESGHIKRNHLVLYDSDVMIQPQNVFAWSNRSSLHMPLSLQDELERSRYGMNSNEFLQHAQYDPAQMQVALQELDANRYYYSYVTFDDLMDYEEVLKFMQRYHIADTSAWCAVATKEPTEKNTMSGTSYGFYLYGALGSISTWDKDTYPALRTNRKYATETAPDEGKQTEHVISMLRYLAEQDDFCEMMGLAIGDDLAQYVEENGLQIYGIGVRAKRETLMQLADCKEVYLIVPHEISN